MSLFLTCSVVDVTSSISQEAWKSFDDLCLRARLQLDLDRQTFNQMLLPIFDIAARRRYDQNPHREMNYLVITPPNHRGLKLVDKNPGLTKVLTGRAVFMATWVRVITADQLQFYTRMEIEFPYMVMEIDDQLDNADQVDNVVISDTAFLQSGNLHNRNLDNRPLRIWFPVRNYPCTVELGEHGQLIFQPLRS